jgi:hypothetical protein
MSDRVPKNSEARLPAARVCAILGVSFAAACANGSDPGALGTVDAAIDRFDARGNSDSAAGPDAESPADAGSGWAQDAAADDAGSSPTVDPPLAGASRGMGGASPVSGDIVTAGRVSYRLIVPSTYSPNTPSALLIVFSGTEGGEQMTRNLLAVADATNTGDFIRAVLDGVQFRGDGAAGGIVLDDLRAKYNIDNDRTYLLGESAGTSAALQLGFHLRQSYFAAYWPNDVNESDAPAMNAAQLGFAPWGQVGPGGAVAIAQQIVDGMRAAGYRLTEPAPYNGPGANQHGSPDQFLAALSWFAGKSRR